MKKHFTRLVILGMVLAGGYFLLNQENVSSYTIPFIEIRTKEVTDKIGSLAGGLKKYVTGQATVTVSVLANDLADTLLERSEQLVSRVADGVKTETFKIFRQAVNEKVDNVSQAVSEKVDRVGANIGIDIQQLGTEVLPPVPAPTPTSESPIIFGIKSGTPAYFTIKNREKETIVYEVNWQDGREGSGEIVVGKSAILSHEWNSAGEYHLQFKIQNSKGEKIYQITISVI